MKYRNKNSGTIVEPSSDLAAQAFERSPDWLPVSGEIPESKPYNKMTTAELEKAAAEHGVDISGCKNNAERAAMITAALAKAGDGDGDPAGDE